MGDALSSLFRKEKQANFCICHLSESKKIHCVKSVQIRSFFCSVFFRNQFEYGKIRTRKNSVFEQVNLCIQVEYGKTRARKNPNLDTFHAVIINPMSVTFSKNFSCFKKKIWMMSSEIYKKPEPHLPHYFRIIFLQTWCRFKDAYLFSLQLTRKLSKILLFRACQSLVWYLNG